MPRRKPEGDAIALHKTWQYRTCSALSQQARSIGNTCPFRQNPLSHAAFPCRYSRYWWILRLYPHHYNTIRFNCQYPSSFFVAFCFEEETVKNILSPHAFRAKRKEWEAKPRKMRSTTSHWQPPLPQKAKIRPCEWRKIPPILREASRLFAAYESKARKNRQKTRQARHQEAPWVELAKDLISR